MITSSYKELQQYIQDIEGSLTPEIDEIESASVSSSLIPSSTVPVYEPPQLLNPAHSQSLNSFDSHNVYIVEHTSSSPEQGWTEQQYVDDPKAGGFVRTVILSGSYGELKKLRVDSEINSETITTSWSASIGENLRVGNNAGVAGYVNLGDTASLKTGSNQPDQDPTQSFAPNVENVPDLRLVVSNSALIQDRLYVGKSVSISGGLDVKEDVRIARNLYVVGNTEITGNTQIVGNTTVTGTLHVSNSIYGSENLYISGDADISGSLVVHDGMIFSGNLQVQGDIITTGSISISQSLYVTDSVHISGNLYVGGDTVLTQSLTVKGPLDVDSNSTFWKDVYISGNLTVSGTFSHLNVEELLVRDKSITVASGATTPAQANGAGFDIDGADVAFRYTASADNMGLNKRLDITGDENITGSLYVTNNTVVSGNVQVVGDEAITGSLIVDQDIYASGSLQVDGNVVLENVTASYAKILNKISSAEGEFNTVIVEGELYAFQGLGVGRYLEVKHNSGVGDSVYIETGSISASGSDLFIQNISASGWISASEVSASMYYGDGRGLINITASIASSSTWKEYIDITAGAAQRLHHLFKTTDVFVQVFEWDDPNYHPDTASRSSFSSPATRVNDAIVKIIDDETVDISYPSPLNGYAVISDAGMMITASVDIQQCATDIAEYNITDPQLTYRFEHKLGTKNILVSVYRYTNVGGDIFPVQIFPDQILIPDQSHVDIVFGEAPINGYIVIAKAGHVVRALDIEGDLEYYNVHRGVTGSWVAKSFTAETISAEVLNATSYVDTPRIGNRDTGPQYYQQMPWGSYIEFSDRFIDSYVRYSTSSDDDVRLVSRLDRDGDLYIRGSLHTNTVFNTSDERKKVNIRPIENALENLKKINGRQFDWKDGSGPSIGVIAQNIEAIYPELTKVVKNFDGEDLMTVNYEGIIGVLIEAVKELSEKVEKLENR